jgi:hypothetical protein
MRYLGPVARVCKRKAPARRGLEIATVAGSTQKLTAHVVTARRQAYRPSNTQQFRDYHGRRPNMPDTQKDPLGWRIFHRILVLIMGRAARKVLLNRVFLTADGGETRWLQSDIDSFLATLRPELDALRPVAELDSLPTTGNRIMVELAVLTIAAYRVLCRLGIKPSDARAAIADTGWNIYGGQLRLASLPFRLTTRDPGLRVQRTIRLLLRFPFSAPGAPGYAVKSWVKDGDIHTHFSHCPPQSFVRNLIAQQGDSGELQAFSDSWCQYDWPGADIIAGDGQRGHYARRRTLSRGDKVCDMCWAARPTTEGPPERTR